MKKTLYILILTFGIANAYASDGLSTDNDTIAAEKPKKGLAAWWANLINGNVDHTFDRPVDMAFAVSPWYSKESSVGIGGQLSALYRIDRTDSLMQPSDFTIMGGGSINGTYSVGLQGNNHFTRDKRLSYTAEFRSQRRNFWGITFHDCDNNPAADVRINRVNVNLDYQQRFYRNWFWSVSARIKNTTLDITEADYLQGQSKHGFFTGLGASIMFDSRDYILNPTRGMYFFYRFIYYPQFLGSNSSLVENLTIQFNAYHKLWQGAIIAYDVFAESNTSGNGVVPWQLREEICYDDRRMRGYYSGSFIDDNQICAQVELRQHLYKRFGAVAWAGAGTLFHNITEVNAHQILPNYGAGIRFEMKKNTNVRMDFGFGRNTSSIIFNFAEAF